MSRRIMIVDDSNIMRQMVGFTLRQAGYSVDEGADGQEALQFLQREQVDLVITDVNMPVMDGITLVRELRKLYNYRFIPILILTTESGDDMKQMGRQSGATGWIVKPFKPEQLCEVLSRLLNSPIIQIART